MKTTKKLGLSAVAALVLALSAGFYATAQTSTITPAQLPAAAQTFIKNNFAGATVTSAFVDKEMFDTDYKVILSNGIEIEFDDKGQWEDIDGNNTALPATVVPKTITDYAASKFAGQHIVQIDKKRSGFEVELSNGTELDFDAAGKFLRIDN